MTKPITVKGVSKETMTWIFAFNANCIESDMVMISHRMGDKSKKYFEEYVQGLEYLKIKLESPSEENSKDYNDGIIYLHNAEECIKSAGYNVLEPVLDNDEDSYTIPQVMLTRTPFSNFNYYLKTLDHYIRDFSFGSETTTCKYVDDYIAYLDRQFIDYKILNDTLSTALENESIKENYNINLSKYNKLKEKWEKEPKK